MMSLIRNRTLTSIRNILIAGSIFFIGGEDTYYEKEPFISFEWDVRLPIDENGYYHLEMNRDTWQTTHRISGNVGGYQSQVPVMVNWESDLYWVLGDTLGYIVKSGYTDEWVYVAYDTVYVTGFMGEEVRTTNWTSYSNSKGEINNMIAPVRSMIGDTLSVGAYLDYELVEVFNIVLD